MSFIRGQANQPVPFEVINATTGAGFAGAVTVYLEKDGGAQMVGTVGAGAATLKGNGSFQYIPSADEFDADVIKFTAIGANAIPTGVTIATITAAEARQLATATGTNAIPVSQLLTRALTELRVRRSGEVPSPDDLALMLEFFNELRDQWNANDRACWVDRFVQYTLTPGHQPHTIGPTGDFVTTYRPVAIKGANLILPTSIRVPIFVRDARWWQRVAAYAVPASVPSDLYYAPAQPNGELTFWPVPAAAYPVELRTRLQQGAVVDTDILDVPQGYQRALMMTLAEHAAASFGQEFSERQQRLAQDARVLVFGNNDEEPTIATADSGLPSGRGGPRGTSVRTTGPF
jgi:hypothetical protein